MILEYINTHINIYIILKDILHIICIFKFLPVLVRKKLDTYYILYTIDLYYDITGFFMSYIFYALLMYQNKFKMYFELSLAMCMFSILIPAWVFWGFFCCFFSLFA